VLAIQDVRVYPDPESDAIEHCTVVLDRGRITHVSPSLPIPAEAMVIPGRGRTLVAGFWNCHVHLTEPFWHGARTADAGRINERLRAMFGSRGFTTVVDLGSDPRVSRNVRARLASGDLSGPRLLTAGTPLYPPAGIPYYVRDSIPFYLCWIIPQPKTPRSATRAVNRSLDAGCDVIKLFTGSYVARGRVLPMPESVAAAAVSAAHARGRLVFSHASNLEGTKVAMQAGVDVLAHAPDSTRGIDVGLVRALVERKMALIPTLKLFSTIVGADREYLDPIYAIVRQFRDAGGELLFGTDVGFISDYTTDGEFSALAESGLSWREILRMLTTAPARRLGVSSDRGVVAAGRAGDVLLLDGDPAQDLRSFARVSATIQGGNVVWDRNP
jgi:imidazolonepropionase-like amidohydrolase